MSAPVVAHLRSSAGMYGAEHVLLGLCDEQVQRGLAVSVVGFAPVGRRGPELLAAASARGVRSIALPCRGPVDARAVLALRRLLGNSANIDVLHCHDYKSVVYAALATSGLSVARVATLHGWLNVNVRLRFYRWLELRALRGFDRVCAVSPDIEQDLLYSGMQPDRISRVDNGVDTNRFHVRDDALGPRADVSAVRLGCAARLSPEKNLAQLILAVAECHARGRRIELTIAGDGPLLGELKRLVVRLRLGDAVKLPGATRQLEDWYPTLDAFVLPSLSEGMPMTVLEAMACGCPVLASAVGSIPDVLSGVPGCSIVPAGNQDALVDALMTIPRRRQPRMAARQRVIASYSVARMADQYEEVYRGAMEARRERLPQAGGEVAALPAAVVAHSVSRRAEQDRAER
jgi:glycosyltransferase involved in cell wall biosynthesis